MPIADQLLIFRSTGAGNWSANENWPSATTAMFLAIGGTPKRGLALRAELPLVNAVSGDTARIGLFDSVAGPTGTFDANPFAQSDLYTAPATPAGTKDIIFRFNTANDWIQCALTITGGHNFSTTSVYVTSSEMRNNLLVGAPTALV